MGVGLLRSEDSGVHLSANSGHCLRVGRNASLHVVGKRASPYTEGNDCCLMYTEEIRRVGGGRSLSQRRDTARRIYIKVIHKLVRHILTAKNWPPQLSKAF